MSYPLSTSADMPFNGDVHIVDVNINITLISLDIASRITDLEIDAAGKLGQVLPDSDEFEVGDASIYATTNLVTSGSKMLKPGLYMYSSASPANTMKALLEYVLTFTGEILDFLPDWSPVGVDISGLADKIKTNGNSRDSLCPSQQ